MQRLWLGSLLALAAWGVVRLLDALLGGRRGSAQLVAGAVLVLNPFVVTYVNRTTVTLLAYAALPWLLLAVHRGLRDPEAWRWPAAFALLVTASGGGVNGAVTAWMLLGPVLLAAYEILFADARWSRAWRARVADPDADRRSPRCGGSCPPTCSRATGSTSCTSPSSRARSGARPASPRACG